MVVVEFVVRLVSLDVLQIRMFGYSVDDLVYRLVRLILLLVKFFSVLLCQNWMWCDVGVGIFVDVFQVFFEMILWVDGLMFSLKVCNLLYQLVLLLVVLQNGFIDNELMLMCVLVSECELDGVVFWVMLLMMWCMVVVILVGCVVLIILSWVLQIVFYSLLMVLGLRFCVVVGKLGLMMYGLGLSIYGCSGFGRYWMLNFLFCVFSVMLQKFMCRWVL